MAQLNPFTPKCCAGKKATLQHAWQTRDSQLPAQTLSLVYLNESIPFLNTRNIKLEVIGPWKVNLSILQLQDRLSFV